MTLTDRRKKVVGILSLQGDFDAHRRVLDILGAESAYVRTRDALSKVDALILPGGESTTIAKLLQRDGLFEPLQERAKNGMPIYGTCAGMILMAREVDERPDQPTLGIMDITVARNAFGRQIDSFEADVDFAPPGRAAASVRGVFIRAPYVSYAGEGTDVISTFRDRLVGVRQSNLLATAFHPELTEDTRVHAYFLGMIEDAFDSDKTRTPGEGE